MSNPILVPLDGSELAEEALPLATELALRWREPLHLVLVHQSPSPFLAPEAGPAGLLGLDEEVRRNLKAYLERTAARVASSSGATVVPVLLDGPVVPVISHYATTRVARLVVMTTHGRGGVSRMFLGSVADRLIRHLRCPAILATSGAALPHPRGAGERRRALIPLDGSRLAESIIDKVLAVYPPREVLLDLLCVVTVPTVVAASPAWAAWRPGAVAEGSPGRPTTSGSWRRGCGSSTFRSTPRSWWTSRLRAQWCDTRRHGMPISSRWPRTVWPGSSGRSSEAWRTRWSGPQACRFWYGTRCPVR